MIIIFGKGMVGKDLQRLCTYLGMENIIMDDGDCDDTLLIQADQIIVSPGVPQFHKLYVGYRDKITGEFDFVYNILKSKNILNNFEFIGITGTDGKSTTTWIVYNLFRDLITDKSVHIGGNFEPTLADIVLQTLSDKKENQKHILILELSSFMAYNVHDFMFDYSIFINFEKDHLNWHADMDDYFNAKMNVINNTKYTSAVSDKLYDKIIDKTKLVLPAQIDISSTKFSGAHNIINIGLALSVLNNYIKNNNLDISKQQISDSLNNISPLNHRTEFICEINGVKIYDDGKSTTANSLKAGINAFDGKLILIAGGSDKGDDFNVLAPDFANKLNGAILIGQTASKIGSALDTAGVRYTIAHSMDEAVRLAYDMALTTGTPTLLFSPGCASFDMFRNRLDRVQQFLQAVNRLNLN